MFARLTFIQVKVESVDDLIKIYKKSVVPAARTQKGYRGVYLLADKKTGKGISISFWNKEEDAVANEENRFYQEELVKFMAFYTSPPIREGYEVSIKA